LKPYDNPFWGLSKEGEKKKKTAHMSAESPSNISPSPKKTVKSQEKPRNAKKCQERQEKPRKTKKNQVVTKISSFDKKKNSGLPKLLCCCNALRSDQ
jgi:hypothetical protein